MAKEIDNAERELGAYREAMMVTNIMFLVLKEATKIMIIETPIHFSLMILFFGGKISDHNFHYSASLHKELSAYKQHLLRLKGVFLGLD